MEKDGIVYRKPITDFTTDHREYEVSIRACLVHDPSKMFLLSNFSSESFFLLLFSLFLSRRTWRHVLLPSSKKFVIMKV